MSYLFSAVPQKEKVVAQEEETEDPLLREADLVRQFGEWLYHQHTAVAKRDTNGLNLGSGCDCDFEVYCVRDADCKGKSSVVDGVLVQNSNNCKMDCCGSRCD